MTRIRYWLLAQTLYHLHSPYLYALYREVLYARLSADTLQGLQLQQLPARRRQYYEILFKTARYFQPTRVLLPAADDDRARRCLQAAFPTAQQTTAPQHYGCTLCLPDGSRMDIYRQPHSAEQKQVWHSAVTHTAPHVSLDLYDVGLILHNTKLSPQQLLLKGWGW